MTLLAFDTSSRHRGLVVLAGEDGTLVAHRPLTGHHLDRELPPAVTALLRDDLTALACVLGPGSYTGLRVGIATALGLAHARDLPLHGIAALEVVARAAPPEASAIAALADAGRGARYLAVYTREGNTLTCTDPPRRIEPGTAWAATATAVSLDEIPGTRNVADRAPQALAGAAAAALRRPPLSRAGLEPLYLSGQSSQARMPRV